MMPQSENVKTPLPLDIAAAQVKQLQDTGAPFLLIDCREIDEYELCRIPGARLIPMKQIPDHIEELQRYLETRIIVQCHHGGRSAQVVRWLRDRGFLAVQSMVGGIDAWSQEVDPSVPRY
jgi:rhodanese-related sulfurtransferase